AAADEQRRAFEDDRVLLGHAVARIGDEVWRGLSSSARSVPEDVVRRLDELAATAPRKGLEETLRAAVDVASRDQFEPARQAQARRAGELWRQATGEFRARTGERLEGVRRAAEGIFDLRLGKLPIPDVADERERFYYLLPRPESTFDLMARGLRRLEPARRARQRLAATARRQLLDELDMDAGRARYDLVQRLDGVRRRFEEAMAAQLADVIDGVLAAAQRSKARRADLAGDLARDDRHAAELRQVTARARAAAAAIEETAAREC
ncbi:MAG TPA: hypothetical protein VI854_02560, partial [Acidimicrobiia bacterium]|nr:hypothetical protein [Acidimicrobiia bacterium]